MKLFLASANPHKLREFQRLAAQTRSPVELASALEAGGMPAVAEDTGTFLGNARKKALALRARLPAQSWSLADDSGLCVEALGGAPGVESAYYAGPGADPAANLWKLADALRGVPEARRGAFFSCTLFLAGPGGREQSFEGRCSGRLLAVPRGPSGFGYDPLFAPEGHAQSFAELGEAVKNAISHRARAWALLAAWLEANRFVG